MSWMQTFTGRQFFPLDPHPEDVDILDIAHSLSNQCRFNGHCLAFYSVAEHSIKVSGMVPQELALWGLLHDSAEAYISDVPKPLKLLIPSIAAMEEKVLRVIAEVFELPWPMPDEVKHADEVLLATEARDIMSPHPAPWTLHADPLEEVRLMMLPPDKALKSFLRRYAQITMPHVEKGKRLCSMEEAEIAFLTRIKKAPTK